MAGELAAQTATVLFREQIDTLAELNTVVSDATLSTDRLTKSMTIETPVAAETFFFFRADEAATVTGIDCIVEDATSAIITVQECDADGDTCTAIEAAMTCAVTNTAHASTIDNASIDAGDRIRVLVGTVSGTPGQVAVDVTGTWD